MPSYYSLPPYGGQGIDNFTVEDVNKYNKLPFYMVMNEVKKFPLYYTFNTLYGKIKWQANMGPIMRGVRPENSPVGSSFVYPRSLQSAPMKNVFETLESTEQAYVKWHRFESKQFHFLPSFQDFRENQLKFNHDDIIRQIAVFNEQFIRGVTFYNAPNIMVVGNNGQAANIGAADFCPGMPRTDLPEANADGTITQPANGKNQGWLQDVAACVGGPLTLRKLSNALSIMEDDLQAPPFEGTVNTPKDNELVKGKYVLLTSGEAWRRFTWDEDVDNLRSIQLDLLFDGFKGSLFGQLTCKPQRFPLRMTRTGLFVPPELTDVETNKTRPNPNYYKTDNPDTCGIIEWSFLCGADAYKTINVGPPPKAFTGRSMSAEKFYSLKWNGEVQLTDQILIKHNDGTYELNRYGTQLQLISQAVCGALGGEINNILPIAYIRSRN